MYDKQNAAKKVGGIHINYREKILSRGYFLSHLTLQSMGESVSRMLLKKLFRDVW